MAARQSRRGIGNVVAPWRFIMFVAIAAVAPPILMPLLGFRFGTLAGFDIAASAFLISCLPLFHREPSQMRAAATKNDANRIELLGVSFLVTSVVVVEIASALLEPAAPAPLEAGLIVGTLLVAWLFSNTVYALHYAHMFYTAGKDGKDMGGLDFFETKEPDYSDFVYFAFCLGMTFQTSDTNMLSRRFRRVATWHCMAAFLFNIGVIAFTINILGS